MRSVVDGWNERVHWKIEKLFTETFCRKLSYWCHYLIIIVLLLLFKKYVIFLCSPAEANIFWHFISLEYTLEIFKNISLAFFSGLSHSNNSNQPSPVVCCRSAGWSWIAWWIFHRWKLNRLGGRMKTCPNDKLLLPGLLRRDNHGQSMMNCEW